MATERKFRRGTAAEHENFTGALGEVTVVTDDLSLRVHDGENKGGRRVASDLSAIARSLNVKDDEVQFTDYTGVLDNVKYLHDKDAQVTYGVPVLSTTGETIVSVSGSELTTSTKESHQLYFANQEAHTIGNIAALRELDTPYSVVRVSGYYTAFDNAFGSHVFEWDSTSTEEDNGGTIIKLDSITTGRYLLKYNDSLNVKWFGSVGDGIADDTDALQNAINEGGYIVFPEGSYYVTNPLYIERSGVHLRGGSVATMVWRGDSDIDNYNRYLGVFSFRGENDTSVTAATPTSDFEYHSTTIEVDESHTLSKGQWVILKGGTPGDDSVGVFPSVFRLVKVTNLDGLSASIDYINGWEIESSNYALYHAVPISNCSIDGFKFDDQMVATASTNTYTAAPTDERNRAICFITLNTVNNIHISNIETFDTKLPVVLAEYATDCEVDKIKMNAPVWVGPGEGYGVQWNNALRCQSSKVITNYDRHNVDFTSASYCSVIDCHSRNSRTYSFKTHGVYEHNITWNRCSGNGLRTADGGITTFGNFIHTAKVINCDFSTVLGYTVDILFDKCNIGKLTLYAGDISFYSTSITVFNSILKDSRLSGYDGVFGGRKKLDVVYMDEGSTWNLTDSTNSINLYGSINGFYDVNIAGVLKTDSSAAIEGVLSIGDCDNITFKGRAIRNKIALSDSIGRINCSGAYFYSKLYGTGGAMLSTRNIDSNNILVVNVSDCTFSLNKDNGGDLVPIQIQNISGTSSSEASVSLQNNIYDSCNKVRIGDSYISIVNASIGNEILVNGSNEGEYNISDEVRYFSGDVNATKGSTGGPAVWSGTGWVDLT